MADNDNQKQSPYKTERFSFIGAPQQRNGTTLSKDQRFVNMFPEQIRSSIGNGRQYYLRQRAGLAQFSNGVAAGLGRGIYYFRGSRFTAVGNQLYRDGVELVTTLATETGRVGFCEYNGTEDALIVLDGVNGYVIKTDFSCTQITSADFPTPHIPFPVYLDGFLFVVKSTTADVYNCKLEDPLTWTAGEFYTAEMFPDEVVALVRSKNYILAVGTGTIEYLYNAAIPTGSPLGRNDSAAQQMGTPAAGTCCESEGEIYLVGSTAAGGRSVWQIKDFKATEIGIEAVRQSLDDAGTGITNATAFVVRSMGHRFYVINLSNRTWVYDMEEKMWHEWATTSDSQKFLCDYASHSDTGEPFFLHPTNGGVLKFDHTHTFDGTIPMPAVITTTKLDLGSMNRKFGHRMTLVCDDPDSVVGTPISVSWSDDDYRTWSTPRTVTIKDDLPLLTQLGAFRRRAFKLSYSGGGKPLRLEGFELDYTMGDN